MFRIILVLLSFVNISALSPIATVEVVRGDVTKLLPGALIANKVKAGDKLFEDTSIVTSSRSFVKILFNDNSKINIGPQSKLVLNQIQTKEGSVISLLKGKIRTSVEPTKDEDKNKFFIKTRTAALGVRGTDFQTIYNPDNKITNLLTFRGKVAMANIENETHISVDNELEIQRADNGKVSIRQRSMAQKKNEISDLNKVLSKNDAVVVEAGQFSGTTTQVDNVSRPVKINPVQLGMLYQNDTFLQKESQASKNIKDATDVKSYMKIEQAAQSVPAEGIFDKEKGIYAPKSGGFIDMETALYIPPEKDAKFDIENQIYIPRNVGLLEVDTGAYVAPKGLKMHPKEGFVLVDSRSSDDGLIAKKIAMNGSLGKELFIEKEEVKQLKVERYSLRELFTKDILSLSAGSYSTDLRIRDAHLSSSTVEKDNKYYFEGSRHFDLNWKMAGNGEYQPFFDFSSRSNKFDNYNGFKPNDSTLYAMSFGLNKYFTTRVFLSAQIRIQQEIFALYTLDNSVFERKLTDVSMTYLSFGGEYQFVKWSNGHLAVHGEFKISLHKRTDELSVKNGFGSFISIDYRQWLRKYDFLEVRLYSDSIRAQVNSGSYSAKNELNNGGLRLSYGHVF